MTPQQATDQCLKLRQAGRLQEALACCNQAMAGAPAGDPWAAVLIATSGEVLFDLGRPQDALAAFDQALARNPGIAAAWNNRGLALNQLGRHGEALDSFARAAKLAPGAVEPHNNHGDTLRRLYRHGEALMSFARALALDPDDTGTLTNRAGVLASLGRYPEALADYSRALQRSPDFPEALFARSHLLWSKKSDLKAALADLTRLVEKAPHFAYARGALMRLKMTAADWHDFDREKKILDDGVAADKKVTAPFIYLSLSDSPDAILRCSAAYAQSNFPAGPPLHRKGPRREGPIRIGYVCGEFREHPVLYLMAGLFEAHDRTRFEIIGFDNGGSDDSALRSRFEKAVPRIININLLSDHDAGLRIAAEEIDILVDLNGYSGEQRLGVFARRPAPIQASYLGYPATLGAPWMDYILADKIVIPESDARHYSEKIAWLPVSFQINDAKRAMARIPSRAEAGLPGQGFVFCNFNHTNKLTPQTFSLWMRILGQTPDSVLWLPRPDPLAEANLKREAQTRGIAPERLIFAPRVPSFEDHLGRLTLADLFLDGQPYGAHTTASDALWAGVPLITQMGGAFAGRVATSLLLALGLPELVTKTEAEFETLAVSLAQSPGRLKSLREKLDQSRATAPLFDTQRTTRAIEQAYQTMFDNRAKPPASFSVPG